MKQKIEGGRKYKVIITCPNCSYGQDPMGCFDGGFGGEDFETLEEAIKYAEDCCRDSIWEYEIKGATKKKINEVYKSTYGYYLY